MQVALEMGEKALNDCVGKFPKETKVLAKRRKVIKVGTRGKNAEPAKLTKLINTKKGRPSEI